MVLLNIQKSKNPTNNDGVLTIGIYDLALLKLFTSDIQRLEPADLSHVQGSLQTLYDLSAVLWSVEYIYKSFQRQKILRTTGAPWNCALKYLLRQLSIRPRASFSHVEFWQQTQSTLLTITKAKTVISDYKYLDFVWGILYTLYNNILRLT